MQIDFGQVINGLNGKPLMDGSPITLGRIAVESLMASHPQEQPTGEEKARRWALALRIHGAGQTEVTVEEAALIKELIGKAYPPPIVGPAWELMEHAPAPGKAPAATRKGK